MTAGLGNEVSGGVTYWKHDHNKTTKSLTSFNKYRFPIYGFSRGSSGFYIELISPMILTGRPWYFLDTASATYK